MNSNEIDKQKESLALDIAFGRSLRLWAKRNTVDAEVAYGWSLKNDFRALVHSARFRAADRIVGCLVKSAGVAIKQLARMCTESDNERIRLAAGSKLIDFWMAVSQQLHFEGRLLAVEELLSKKDEGFRSGNWPPLPRWSATSPQM